MNDEILSTPATRQSNKVNVRAAEVHDWTAGCSADEDLAVQAALGDRLQHVLPVVDARLRFHAGHCSTCRRDPARTVDQARFCMSRNSWVQEALRSRGPV